MNQQTDSEHRIVSVKSSNRNLSPMAHSQQQPAPERAVEEASAPPLQPIEDSDGQSPNSKANIAFTEKTIRAEFIRKVFGLVAIMLCVIICCAAIPYFIPSVGKFLMAQFWIGLVAIVAFFATYITMICCEKIRRTFPTNLIVTGILVLCIGYGMALIVAASSSHAVFLALFTTIFSCGAVIAFSTQVKVSMTSCLGVAILLALFLFVLSIMSAIFIVFFKIPWLHILYTAIAALLFMIYLSIDIQLLMGGHRCAISPEEYIFASVQILIDIVFIFTEILHCLQCIAICK